MPLPTKRASKQRDVTVSRHKLATHRLDIGGRDLFIAFNEPAFRYSQRHLLEADLDSKLNARLPSYFLPAVALARVQTRRPRLFIVSGLNMALKYNAQSDRQKTVMMIDNHLKLDFLRSFFETFFLDDFSVVEYVVAQDPIKITDEKLLALWKVLERRYPEHVQELKLTLARYKRPHLFNSASLSDEALAFLNSKDQDLLGAFKYAVSHLFAMADINFEGNYIHNPVGYVTIGGPTEKVFNQIRDLALSVLQDIAELVFERDVIYKDNIRLVIENSSGTPVPYNGNYRTYGERKLELAEVTYENEKGLDFYDQYEKLASDMEYIYQFVPRERYWQFWQAYRARYFDLKRRYREAYKLAEDF